MEFFTQRDIATLFLDGSAIALTLCILILSQTYKKNDRKEDSYFSIMLIINCILSLGDILGSLFEMKTTPESEVLRMAGMTSFYCGILLISMIWIRYCYIRFKNVGMPETPGFSLLFVPGFIVILLFFTNLFTGFIFTFDEKGEFKTGSLYIVFHIVAIAYIIIGISYLAKYRGSVSGMRLVPMWVFVFLGAFGIVFTFVIKSSASFVPICLTMALTFTHMGTINEVLALSYKKTISGTD